MLTQGILINYKRDEIEQRLKLKFNALQFFLNKSLKQLEKQLEQIIQRLGEYEVENHQMYYQSFPCQYLEEFMDTIEFSIQKSMNLDIKQYFLDNKFNNFDENLKFQSFELFDLNTKIKQTVSCEHYAFCLIRNPIKLESPTSITLNIDSQQGDVGFGLCDIEVMIGHNFRPKINILESGAFVIFQDKYTIHSDRQDINWKTLGLKFQENDTVKITYYPDTQKLQWINVKTQETYEYNIDNIQRQLHFCVVMKKGGSIISIIQ